MMSFITNIWKKVIGILLAGCIFYFFAHFFYASLLEKNDIHLDNISKKSTDRVVVKGLRINESKGDRPFFSVEIGRIRYEHKKIGFLRFGMLPVAVVEGFKLTVYDTDAKNTHSSSQVKRQDKLPVSAQSPYASRQMLKARFSGKSDKSTDLAILGEIEKYVSDPEFMKLFKLDRAHNIRFETLHFKMVRNGREVLNVNCRRLVPDIKNNLLKLSGDVRIVTESKKVEGESFSFDWKKNRLLSKKEYKLISNEYTVTRKGLNTDIFLSSL